MATANPSNGDGFRRQVTFRISPEDAPLLETAAREHGGIQAGIVAALRAYAAQRLQAAVPSQPPAQERQADAPAPPVPERRQPKRRRASARTSAPPKPVQGDDERVELNVAEAALVLGISAASLRARIKEGRHPGRLGATGFYLAELSRGQLRESGLELSPRGAAEVLGLRPGTIKSRCKAGRYPNACNDGFGWSIPASDIL